MIVRTLAVTVAVLLVLVLAHPKWNELDGYTFEQYQVDFVKRYTAKEMIKRQMIFNQRLKEIKEFNIGKRLWRKGVNHLTDRTVKELEAMRGHRPVGRVFSPFKKAFKFSGKPIPKSVDYRKAVPPILTAVKDQGECGSCWAHAAIEQLETFYALKTNKLFVLSQQQLVSCVVNTNDCGGTGGCGGATAELGITYAAANGITQEWQYAYQSYTGVSGTCSFNSTTDSIAVKPKGYVILPRNNERAVMDALANIGPLAISGDASEWSAYESGIFDGCNYAKNITMDHAIQLVGYGYDNTLKQEYWIVRNSWNPTYGEDGYIRLIKRQECGWDNYWASGGGCKGQPNNVYTCGQCGVLYDTLYPVY